MYKGWATLIGLCCILCTSAAYSKEVFQCKIQGRTVFQNKPCPENIKTYEEVFNVKKDDTEEKKQAQELADKEYQERLKQSAAQRGDLIVVKPHKTIAVDKLKTGSRPMAFNVCKQYIQDAQLSTPKPFKTSVISDTKTENLVRICRKDGSIILACSEAEKKLIITTSAHCPLK